MGNTLTCFLPESIFPLPNQGDCFYKKTREFQTAAAVPICCPNLLDYSNGGGNEYMQKKTDSSLFNGNSLQGNKLGATLNAQLYQNVPNPFNSSSTIEFDIPVTCNQAFIYYLQLSGRTTEGV